MQSDPMLPYRGWFALMNRGVLLTPVGASDSHPSKGFDESLDTLPWNRRADVKYLRPESRPKQGFDASLGRRVGIWRE